MQRRRDDIFKFEKKYARVLELEKRQKIIFFFLQCIVAREIRLLEETRQTIKKTLWHVSLLNWGWWLESFSFLTQLSYIIGQ